VTGTTDGRVRYRDVLVNREFAAIFTAQTLSLLGDQLARIALAILVYRRTGSAFGASATFAVSYLTYLVGGPLLSGVADRYPRLTVMVACDLLRAPLVLLLCVTSLPLWTVFVVIGLLGTLAPPFDSSRSSLQPDILAGEEYVVGNALINVAMEAGQVGGFVLGGGLVAATSVRGALAVDAVTFLLSAGLLLSYVRSRDAAQAPEDRGAFLKDALEGLHLVARRPDLRALLAIGVLGSIAVTSTEGLAVAVARDMHGGPALAGVLTATVPAGFLLGSFLVLRQPAETRTGLLPKLLLLSAAPLLLSPIAGSVAVLIALWLAAGAGATLNLIAGPEFMQRCPRDYRGRAFGLAVSCLQAAQGVGLLAAGLLAEVLSPRTAVAVVALVALLAAIPVLATQGKLLSVREVT
jgi:predicted MFS family arabinose efflux permease